MKKLIVQLVFLSVLLPYSVKCRAKLFTIESSDIMMVLRTEKDSDVSLAYFGDKFYGYNSLSNKQFPARPDTKEAFTPMLYPAYGGRMTIEPILKLTHFDGNETCQMKLDSVAQRKVSENINRTTVYLSDKRYKLAVSIAFDAYWKENVITQQVTIANHEKGPVSLDRFYSSYLPVAASSYYLTHFYGTWADEMQIDETKLSQGTVSIETKKEVRATQSENPSFMLALNQPAKPDCGDIIMGALAWSGNFKLNFEVDECNTLNILSGINPFASSYKLPSKQTFVTPKMIITYSHTGYGQASRNLHDWALGYNLKGGNQPGKVVLNSWEGTSFNFNEEVIKTMIDNAAKLGIETFVLDDGWFGNNYPRNSDQQGLGDWQVNRKKLPHGVDALANYAVSKGLKFGIWIEPEMVNPQSDLAKAKPSWIVKSPYREIPTLRNQWLLDLSNPAVQNYVYQTVKQTIGLSKNISYLKWDANRHVESFGSTYLPKDKQSHFWIDYVNGLYSVYQRLRNDFPDIEIQLCASGGGRLDFGALQYHNEFWTSDDTDPFQRLKIQFATNLIYPPKATAAHVSKSPNYQTGNTSSLKFRFHVAMMGRLGIELQPKDLSEQELSFVKSCISDYKSIRHIVDFGDWYPLHSPYSGDNYAATQFVTKDKKEALLFAFSMDFHPRTYMPVFKLAGLDSHKMYKVMEICTSERSSFWGNNMSFSGDYLMNAGVNLNLNLRGESSLFYLQEQ
ncbi:MAG: alpha-galactosidase [Bacteroidota bacterium]|nr:alpha-galactosidase [Bacteroidota bacterium]